MVCLSYGTSFSPSTYSSTTTVAPPSGMWVLLAGRLPSARHFVVTARTITTLTRAYRRLVFSRVSAFRCSGLLVGRRRLWTGGRSTCRGSRTDLWTGMNILRSAAGRPRAHIGVVVATHAKQRRARAHTPIRRIGSAFDSIVACRCVCERFSCFVLAAVPVGFSRKKEQPKPAVIEVLEARRIAIRNI